MGRGKKMERAILEQITAPRRSQDHRPSPVPTLSSTTTPTINHRPPTFSESWAIERLMTHSAVCTQSLTQPSGTVWSGNWTQSDQRRNTSTRTMRWPRYRPRLSRRKSAVAPSHKVRRGSLSWQLVSGHLCYLHANYLLHWRGPRHN